MNNPRIKALYKAYPSYWAAATREVEPPMLQAPTEQAIPLEGGMGGVSGAGEVGMGQTVSTFLTPLIGDEAQGLSDENIVAEDGGAASLEKLLQMIPLDRHRGDKPKPLSESQHRQILTQISQYLRSPGGGHLSDRSYFDIYESILHNLNYEPGAWNLREKAGQNK